MTLPEEIAKDLREVFYGGNWTAVNLKENLSGITWQEAITRVYTLNTIAALVYHLNYYLSAVLKVLLGSPLDAHDKHSFDCPPISSQADWDSLLSNFFTNGQSLTDLIQTLPESKLWEDFTDNKYGNYYRNLNGIIEHTHYHLGQIVLIKKLLLHKAEN